MSTEHIFRIRTEWTGAGETGTTSYTAYGRDHIIHIDGKPPLAGSADPAFRGDGTRYNPEDMFLASLSTCHLLWYLHLCASAGVTVTAYEDRAEGTLQFEKDGSGRFTEVILRPHVTLAPGNDAAKAEALHHDAHKKCFIANSVSCPVRHVAVIQ